MPKGGGATRINILPLNDNVAKKWGAGHQKSELELAKSRSWLPKKSELGPPELAKNRSWVPEKSELDPDCLQKNRSWISKNSELGSENSELGKRKSELIPRKRSKKRSN